MERLDRRQILEAFESLATELGPADHPFELFVVGGAALVLLYGARESTRDVDAFSAGGTSSRLMQAAARVAANQGLPLGWLNDAAKGYVHGLSPGPILFETGNLRIRALAPPQLLAMKLSAWRDDVDIEDARLLLAHSGGEKEELWAKIEPHLVPGRELKARFAFDDLWEAAHGPA